MKIDETSKFITLDWDNINLQEALVKFLYIHESPNTCKTMLSYSARKGFHCRVWLRFPVLVAKYRFSLGDDPRRILHDIFNRPDNIHDILWLRKTIQGHSYKSREIVCLTK